jgi:hypothetical protein
MILKTGKFGTLPLPLAEIERNLKVKDGEIQHIDLR